MNLVGILLILPASGGTVTIVDSGGSTIAGLAFTMTAVNYPGQFIDLRGIPYSVSASTADGLLGTVGIKLSNTSTFAAALMYST